MAFSYLSVIYSDLDKSNYLAGKNLANRDVVEITRSYNNGCRAIVHLGSEYITYDHSRGVFFTP